MPDLEALSKFVIAEANAYMLDIFKANELKPFSLFEIFFGVLH